MYANRVSALSVAESRVDFSRRRFVALVLFSVKMDRVIDRQFGAGNNAKEMQQAVWIFGRLVGDLKVDCDGGEERSREFFKKFI